MLALIIVELSTNEYVTLELIVVEPIIVEPVRLLGSAFELIMPPAPQGFAITSLTVELKT